jgi:hypothetical protein
MNPLERRCCWLLRAYPRWYRRQRGDEMLATLLEASQPGQRWPSARDVRALIMGGLRVRAGQDQQLTTAANLRLAAQLGAALTLLPLLAANLTSVVLIWTHSYASNPRPGYVLAYTLLGLAAVVAAWFAPRPVVAVLAVSAAGAWVYWGDRGMAILPAGLLVLLAVLVFLGERLPRSWLWLAGGLFAVNALQAVLVLRPLYFLYVLLALGAFVDARPAIAMGMYIACTFVAADLLNYVGGVRPLMWPLYLPVAGAAVLASGAFWRLRRQAVL